MDAAKQEFIDRLNDALSWELAGIIQYMQHSVMVTGPLRESLYDFFSDGSEEARDHAEKVGERIAALGGIPTVEPAKIRQATGVEDMLEAALELEKDALAAWEDAHRASKADGIPCGYMFYIEEQIAEEQEHVDHLRKMTNEVSFADRDIKGDKSTTG